MPSPNRPLAAARRTLRECKEAKRKHRQLCRTCTQFTGTRARWCDAGWAIEQAIRQAEFKLSELTQEAAGPGKLF